MGIPFYFREVIRQHRNVLTNLHACDRLFLDFNSIIHTCSQKVVNSKVWRDRQALEAAILKHIVQYTEFVASTCQPSQLLYIAIDGVAPLAKMSQQRKRRHMTALRNKLINDYKTNNGIPFTQWDSNCITPGTQFMSTLSTYLKQYFSASQSTRGYEVYISDSEEIGEGEHKAIHYIKNLGRDSFVDVIYGLDADLIMLALTCEKQKIYLMRESTQFCGNKHYNKRHENVTTFKYVNIDVLRTGIARYFAATDDHSYMLDYVFICFFLGNDFLPHFPSISLKHEGLQYLCDTYKEMQKHCPNTHIIVKEHDRYTIHYPTLVKFIKHVAENEHQRFAAIVKQFYETPIQEQAFKNKLEHFIYTVDYMPMLRRKKVIDPEKEPAWRLQYYSTFFDIVPNDFASIDAVSENYMHGLYWNVDYYFNNIFSHSWYYKYNTAPFLMDIESFLQKHNTPLSAPNQISDTCISSTQQLLVVLPFQSLQLLPKHITDKIWSIESGCAHLYPISFDIISFLKTQLWECTPHLPRIDLQKITRLLA